jgi:hypothetical protein
MADAQRSQSILGPQALAGLHKVKQQIQDEACARISQRLVRATTAVAVRLARPEDGAEQELPARVAELVQDALAALARRAWKPDTALKLGRRRPAPGHGCASERPEGRQP